MISFGASKISPKEPESFSQRVYKVPLFCTSHFLFLTKHFITEMRKFFSFRSLGSSSTNCNGNSLPPTPPSSDDLVCRDKLWDYHSNTSVHAKIQDLSQTLKDSTLKPLNRYSGSEDSSRLLHRRSHSFSSCVVSSGIRERNHISLSDPSRSTSSCANSPHCAPSCQMHCHPVTPERYIRHKSSDLSPSQHSHAVDKCGSPSSLRDCEILSGNSSFSSPMPLRCNAACLSWFPKGNELLHQYIDGEDQEVKPETHSEKCFSESGIDCCLVENRTNPIVGRPEQLQSTALPLPMYRKENTSTYSFREEKDTFHHFSAQDWTRDDYGTVSSWRRMKKSIKKPLQEFPGKLTMDSPEYDSESSTTFEDIYMDSFESQRTLHSDDVAQHCSTDDYPSHKKLNGYFTQDLLGLESCACFLEHGPRGTKNGKKMCSEIQDTDEELLKNLKEVEKMTELLPEEDFDLKELQSSDLGVSSLFQTIKNLKEDRKYLLLGLLAQLKCRLADRYAAKEHLRQARTDLNTRTRRLEWEKNELQFSLEDELDRRSSDWSMKLEKIQLEEQRLRERVRELAEQNVSFQQEISSLKGIEGDNQIKIVNSEIELTNLTASLEQLRTENYNLQKALSERLEHFNATEEERDCIRRCFRETERENKELQKLVVRLQRICNEQERSINGLRLGFSDEIENKSTDRSDQLSRLQMEQLRLTRIEQNLRKELETCKHELEALRHENIGLLSRLQAAGIGCGFSSIKVEQELHARVECLQTQGLSLLNDISHFNRDLLEFLKRKQFEHGHGAENDSNRHSFVDYTIKSQSLSRRHENFRRSLQTIAIILDEKSHSQAVDYQSLPAEGGMSKQSEDELEVKLKAEIILTRLLREKLYSNDLELERLQADLASSIRVHDVLQTEIQRMQDEVSCLTHKTTDMELQMLQKDESIKQLENECQECTKELTAARNILLKVTEERNHMWEEVKNLREKIMLLNYEVISLKKKIEELDEDILTKEGQISILRDSLEKPFDIICSPRSVKEFSLE